MSWPITKTFAVVVFALFIKIVATLVAQNGFSRAAGTNADMVHGKRNTAYTASGDGHDLESTSDDVVAEKDHRWRRIVQNDLESIPIALLVFWASITVNGNSTINHICLWVFLAARLAHTLMYAMKLQPFRTIAWGIGILAVLVSAVAGLIEIIF